MSFTQKRIYIFGAFLLAAATSSVHAAVDLSKSSISATAKQIGVPIEGTFKKMRATIEFNAAKLPLSTARVDIDVASYDMGAPDYNKEVTGKDWFNAAQFPKATFLSTGITAAGGNKYTVSGKLTLKGKTVDVAMPFTVKTEGNSQIFDGVLPIRRTAFNIGDGEWKDTSVVSDEVLIKLHLVTTLTK